MLAWLQIEQLGGGSPAHTCHTPASCQRPKVKRHLDHNTQWSKPVGGTTKAELRLSPERASLLQTPSGTARRHDAINAVWVQLY